MSITTTAIIQTSNKFNGAFEVVHYERVPCYDGAKWFQYSKVVTPCANLATARTIRDRLNSEGVAVAVTLPKSVERSLLSAEELAGCRTGGLGYDPAVTWALTGRVERVHNWATARTLSDRFPVAS